MTPVELPMRNYSDVTATSDQSPARNDNTITLPTNYNTIQVDPLPVASLRDSDGGYLGPAAIPPPPTQDPPLPHAHESARGQAGRPQNGVTERILGPSDALRETPGGGRGRPRLGAGRSGRGHTRTPSTIPLDLDLDLRCAPVASNPPVLPGRKLQQQGVREGSW
ncbi:hypothetical protein C7M84_005786 [Penaeus vannamei]|uniref:Uncharacterized protein n=1 Tax=Penaeus vannamei TaxID=6689 RepID=A0A3R7MGB2_PENVA|nr:hypothetical protein C7M84_005786 [Penaeus vannamei]